ncbi:glycoside hydrolase family 27 protein [Butyrivibrio sp. DSM 10294]|uniref:glycoside hydrolase family 27 protein n=1 Tax=Butyrivibrio sp. DSM 10294 TaxID=2972457 RepID=UPI00234EC472|nr:glycoside hydrolase family 27 protein [Butyrivibrio sp. DSM 10294]MDC7292427.1 glycoside hydrolase family 27 protein [Butyrivibrio sp. DSM 10294]
MAEKTYVAKRPPMGWNSWDCYGASVNEEQLLGNARYMAEHLKEFGWEYVVCDIQWYEPTADSHWYHKFTELEMDEYSRLIPAVNRFPSSAGGKGFGPIAKEIHDMGLKFGIHIMRGIPRQAVHRNTHLLGTTATARDIAQTGSICMWNTDMYGVDASVMGAQEYYNSIFEMYAEWGVDYVKVDDIARVDVGPEAPGAGFSEIAMIKKAIENCGRPMVLSLSPGPARVDQKDFLLENANMWRMTDDFWDKWEHLYGMFERCHAWEGIGCKDHWPDCDMLPLGKLCLIEKEGGGHYTSFTKDEQRVLMTLWCMFRSPLMFGGEMRENDDFTLELMTNTRLLDMHRYGRKARQISREDDLVVWKSLSKDGKKAYVAFFNISEEKKKFKIRFKDLEIKAKNELPAANMWTGEGLTLKNKTQVELKPHSVLCYELGISE